MEILQKQHFFFIGVGGAGMSAIAQYLSGLGKNVSGSDRLFNFSENEVIKKQLEDEGISCFLQDGSGLKSETEIMVASTAIEDDNIEILKAKSLGIPIIRRSELLAAICKSKKTIAIGGTSGKSTTTAMMFHMLLQCNIDASLISGAGLVSLIEKGKIGNAWVGKSEYLLIEADESDGSLVLYEPFIGVLLNMDKDHMEMQALEKVFNTFRENSKHYFIVNHSGSSVSKFSKQSQFDFGTNTEIDGKHFYQEGFSIEFDYKNFKVKIPTIGRHNMENALACLAVAELLQIDIAMAIKALATYPGIYRRHQLLGEKDGILFIDDYAHNPAKIAASIRSAQDVGKRVIAWFQPHGYKPTKFIREELVSEIANTFRDEDIMLMSEIYYAGGTTTKDISANDIIEDLKAKNINAKFIEDRNNILAYIKTILRSGDVLLLMGARDPSLEKFSKAIYENY